MDPTAREQFALLERMSALADPPCIMGGYAEDALLAGTVTRPHGDIDWLCTRRELDFRLEQARQLGFERLDTWGEAAPGPERTGRLSPAGEPGETRERRM